MFKVEDRCCGCAVPGYPCEGNSCSKRNVRVHYCDKCGDEITDDVYEVDGEDLCEDCLKEMFLKEDV